MKHSFSQSNLTNSTKRPLSASSTNINIQKREKLKKLLVEKITKKFDLYVESKFIEMQVGNFVQKEKLTENDLKAFEESLKKILIEKKEKENLKINLTKKEEDTFDHSLKEFNNNNEETRSVRSNMSNFTDLSKKFQQKMSSGIKYEDITSFELRKLLENDRKPVIRQKLENRGTEWNQIDNYKNKLWEESKKENKILDKKIKAANRSTFNQQIGEKQKKREEEKRNDNNFHWTLMNTVDKLTQEHIKKTNENKEKKLNEKYMRDLQIQENINKKKNEFVNNRSNDNQLIKKNLSENEKEKQKEVQEKLNAQENLKRMLRENEENKIKQKDEVRKEKEEEIKYMEEYTRILDRQEQSRADCLKKSENRQNEATSRMVESIIKQQDLKVKEDEQRIKNYQQEKEKRDQEQEEREKKATKNSKSYMRDYLTNQMVEKKTNEKVVKQIEDEQLKMWEQENEHHFTKQKETNERVYQMNKMCSEYLKSQMMTKKQMKNDTMGEEEYRLNRNLLEGIADLSTPYTSKKNFLI